MENKAKRIIIIGNGYDLFQGLPTSFSDFVDFCKYSDFYFQNALNKKEGFSNYDINQHRDNKGIIRWSEKLATNFPDNNLSEQDKNDLRKFENTIKDSLLIKYCLQQEKIKNFDWHDFENHICNLCHDFEDYCNNVINIYDIKMNMNYMSDNLIQLLDSFNLNNGCFNHEIKTLSSVIEQSDFTKGNIERDKKLLINMLSDELDKFSLSFNYYIKHIVTNIPLRFALNIKNDGIDTLIINFNYTWNEQVFKNSKYLHIHGLSTDNNIIIGINDDNLSDAYIKLQKKFKQQLLKTNLFGNPERNSFYYDLDEWMGFCAIEKTKYDVCVLGHSLDKIDSHILNPIFNSTMFHSVYAYVYSEENKNKLFKNLYSIFGYEKINNMSGTIPNIIFLPYDNLVKNREYNLNLQ